MVATLELSRVGTVFRRSCDGGDLWRLLEAIAEPDTSTVVVDCSGVRAVAPFVFHMLLRAAKRTVAPAFPDSRIRFTSLDFNLEPTLRFALSEREDFLIVNASGGALELALAEPQPGEADGIGLARRKMRSLIARDGCGCVWCGLELTPEHPLASIDHVRPHSQDGANTLDNLVMACRPCNNGRRSRPASEWMKRCLTKGMQVNVEVVEAAIVRSKRARRSKLTSRQKEQSEKAQRRLAALTHAAK
jgi:hypothetical protein